MIFTIGHSNLPLEAFLRLLKAHQVDRIVDVRTVPRSRHNPQFNQETLPGSLAESGTTYTHLPGLGGLRHSRAESINMGWRNASFRGFADYMQTEAFADSLSVLIQIAQNERPAVMCAEAVPWARVEGLKLIYPSPPATE